ncbi:hypothetical protein AYK20_06255 [Thermoplasmatales archaeon SG8-52-1]|nr:MAG: hypothetical protein AYK20_06255 [Thermoplasmatales archaeon SG8-52-1]
MAFEILKIMIKEEWRLHTSLFGNRMFAFFPLMIGISAFIASMFLPNIQTIMTTQQMLQSANYIFILFGVTIGSFGLTGKEILNRRFGQASLIAYSSRSLPVSERTIFLNFLIKDIIYYVILWILPITFGLVFATLFIEINTISILLVCGTLILSFLIGLSIVFFLSTIYAHSIKLLIVFLTIGLVVFLVLINFYNIGITTLLLPYSMYYNPSLSKFFLIMFLIFTPSTISLIFLKVDYPEKKRQYKNSLMDLSYKFKFSQHSYYIAKDFLDLKRSEGGLGKIIFSFLFPIGLTWLFLYIFLELIPTVKAIMIFAVFLGIVSASIYNILTAFDTFNPYMFLPVKVSTIIKSKITSYLIVSIFSLLILVLATISLNQLEWFIPALFSFVTISVYSLSMTIYFAGLHPTILFYNSKIFAQYICTVSPILFVFTIVSILDPFIMLASPVLLIPASFVLKKSYKKWDKWKPLSI